MKQVTKKFIFQLHITDKHHMQYQKFSYLTEKR